MKTLRHSVCALMLAGAPFIATAQQTSEHPETSMRLGDVLGLLIGAYNGAADAAEQGGYPLFEERLSEADAARLKRGLNYVQSELQSLVKEDGTLDSKRAAELLNALQQLQGGETRFDFVKAEAALERARHQKDGALLDQLLSAVGGAGAAALSADVAQYKRLAAEQLGGAYRHDTLVDTLKLVYADRKLDSVSETREAQAHALIAATMQQGGITREQYDEIRRLLDAIGGPFKPDYKAWRGAQESLLRPAVNSQEVNNIINALQNKTLTPEQREEILRALQR